MDYLKKAFSVHLKWKERGGKANKLNGTLGCQVMFVRCYGQSSSFTIQRIFDGFIQIPTSCTGELTYKKNKW